MVLIQLNVSPYLFQEGEFDRAGSMITATIDRVRQLMVNQRGQNYLGYTVVFVVAVFILLYIIFL